MVMEPDMDLLNETTWIQAGVDGRFGEVRATEYGCASSGTWIPTERCTGSVLRNHPDLSGPIAETPQPGDLECASAMGNGVVIGAFGEWLLTASESRPGAAIDQLFRQESFQGCSPSAW